MIPENFVPTIENVRNGYISGDFTPEVLIGFLLKRIDNYADRNVWISTIDADQLAQYCKKLETIDPASLPLYGVPFAIKDNIDVAGFNTTAACPAYTYQPAEHATIIKRLIDAGAIPVGKTNLDQFATGLVGTRSPHGPCKNAFNPEYISGGSSAGSAVSVSLGLVSFSLGTDTAGSGRVPAMLNNLIGLKPSRGLFSMHGVIPACRSLDCPSVFAFNSVDAATVFTVAEGFDSNDSYSRANPFANSTRGFGADPGHVVIGVPKPEQLQFFGEDNAQQLFEQTVAQWRSLNAQVVELDFQPLFDAAKLLYEGPWVAERYAAIESFIEASPEQVHDVVRGIIQGANGKTAVDAFNAAYQLQDYKAYADDLFSQVDALILPTAPRHYTIEAVLADPVTLNSNMGYYTNFMNLLDLCGLAVPSGFLQNALPFGYTLVAPAFSDTLLLNLAKRWEQSQALPVGSFTDQSTTTSYPAKTFEPGRHINVAVCGAHLESFPLNWQLTERGATLSHRTETAPRYQMYLLDNPPRPGLITDHSNGVSIAVEVWSVPAEEFGSFVDNIPYPLGIGKVELVDGSMVSGFVCDAAAVSEAENISAYGSWKNWTARA